MIETIYLEDAAADHPRARSVLDRFSGARIVACERYTEVFNPSAQTFRLQKQRPALILARKRDNHALVVPPGFGIGDGPAFYFSHMLNCLYDCRYCFLQGMFRSAHYVLFVNYEDFEDAIDERLAACSGERAYFFSGYDCDSLALESVTGFVEHFLPFFAARPDAILEIRTKSVATRPLRAATPSDNVVVAFSLTPAAVANAVEHGAPGVDERIAAAADLAGRGWRIGLRLDPLVWHQDWRDGYSALVDELSTVLPAAALHSVSLGPMRFPPDMFQRIERMYPDDQLLNGPLHRSEGTVSYGAEREARLVDFVADRLAGAFPDTPLFSCSPAPA